MRNVMTVDLELVRRNVHSCRSRLSSGVKLCAVVKADAYGHGAAMLSREVQADVDAFAVALVEEGIELRLAGVLRPVLVLLPVCVQEIERALWYGLTLSVASLGGLYAVERVARKIQMVASVHFAVDTGMNRVGFTRQDRFLSACRYAASSPFLCLSGVFSHFSSIEQKETEKQYATFRRRVALARKFAPELTAHIAATPTFENRTYQEDMVRVGLALYGYGVRGVQPVMMLTVPTISRRTVGEGARLLYAPAPNEKKRVKIVRVGYADGFLRSGNTAFCVPMAMDTAAVDGADCASVEILGKNRRADVIARETGTIAYEVLVKASIRAERVYIT